MGKSTNTKSVEAHPGDEVIAGAFAGATARIVTAPLDVLKIRFQLQFGDNKKYTSITQALRMIIMEEGVWYNVLALKKIVFH